MESNQQIELAELQKKDHFGSRILAQMVRWFKSLQRLALLPMMTSLQLALTSFDSCTCTRGTFSFEQPDNKSRGRPVRSHSDWGEGWHGFEDPWDWTFPNRVDFQRARSLGSLLRSPSRNWKLKTTLFFWAPASRPMPRGGQKMLLMISMSWLSFSTTLIAYLWDIELSCDLSEVRSFQSSHSILNSTRGPVWLLKHLRQELWKPFGASDPCGDLHLCFSVSLVTLWIFIHNLPLLELLFVTLCRGAMRIQPFTNFGKRFCSVVRWFLMDLLTCSLKQLVFLVWPLSLHSSCLGLSFHLRLFWTLPLVGLKALLRRAAAQALFTEALSSSRKDFVAGDSGVLDFDLAPPGPRRIKPWYQRLNAVDESMVLGPMAGALPTADRLYQAGGTSSPNCRSCGKVKEDMNHLVKCEAVWNDIGKPARVFEDEACLATHGILEVPTTLLQAMRQQNPLPELHNTGCMDFQSFWIDGSIYNGDHSFSRTLGLSIINEDGEVTLQGVLVTCGRTVSRLNFLLCGWCFKFILALWELVLIVGLWCVFGNVFKYNQSMMFWLIKIFGVTLFSGLVLGQILDFALSGFDLIKLILTWIVPRGINYRITGRMWLPNKRQLNFSHSTLKLLLLGEPMSTSIEFGLWNFLRGFKFSMILLKVGQVTTLYLLVLIVNNLRVRDLSNGTGMNRRFLLAGLWTRLLFLCPSIGNLVKKVGNWDFDSFKP